MGTIIKTRATLSSTMNMFRQGVSIRTWKQYFRTSMGPHVGSGEKLRWFASGSTYSSTIFDDSVAGRGPSRIGSINVINEVVHELEISNYGQPSLFREDTPFEELESEYILSGSGPAFLVSLDSFYKGVRYPNVLFNKTMKNPAQMDGVIEPLTIRREIEFSALEGSDVFHKLRASLEGEYTETIRGHIPIMQQVAFKPVRIEPFLDQGEVFASSSAGDISLPGLIMDERIEMSPFKDESIQQFRAEGVSDSGMREVLMEATGSQTDRMFIHDHRSTAAGFIYININKFRTDSVAFGGLKK